MDSLQKELERHDFSTAHIHTEVHVEWWRLNFDAHCRNRRTIIIKKHIL